MILTPANEILDAMEIRANELGITGVAAYVIRMPNDSTITAAARIVGRMERPPEVERGDDDTGTNYFAVVMAKIAEMLSTLRHSGHSGRLPKKGEVGWPGGLIHIRDNVIYCFAFSGGSGDEDIEVAVAGMIAAGINPD